MHRDVAVNAKQYARFLDDVGYAATVALPEAVSEGLSSLHWRKLPHLVVPDGQLPHLSMLHIPWPHFALPNIPGVAHVPHAMMEQAPHAKRVAAARGAVAVAVDDAALGKSDDSDAKLAQEPVPGIVDDVLPSRPEPHARTLTDTLESHSKPLMPSSEMLRMTVSREHSVMLANVSASRGGFVRFEDGSYLSIAPNLLPHDIGIRVSLSSPALPDTRLFDAQSEAMVIKFRPLAEAVEYAAPARPKARGSLVGLAITNNQRTRLSGHVMTFVKRVFLTDGSSANFGENPTKVTPIMTADLAEDHVLNFTAHVGGTVVVTLQRLKGSDMVGFRE